MIVETAPVADLVLDPANVRLHGPKNLEAIKGSLARFGQQKPIVVSKEGIVIAGNGTLVAARDLGWTSIDVVRTELEGAEAIGFAIADNRTAELAEWDDPELAKLLAQLQNDENFETAATGFSDAEIDRLIAQATNLGGDDDAAPEPPETPETKLGDVYKLGDHRLLCGDATSFEDVERLLEGETPFLMVTDPPSGVDYEPNWRNEAKRRDGTPFGASSTGEVANDNRADWRDAYRLFPGDVAYVWHAGRACGEIAAHLYEVGFEIRAQVVWAKSRFAISRGHYHWQHEPCWYSVRKGRKAAWIGDRSQTTIWDVPIGVDESSTHHGTQKPVELFGRPIRNHETDAVYDPFCGSGTSIVAAEKLGKRAFALELDPAYCDVIVARWEALTGRKAERVGRP